MFHRSLLILHGISLEVAQEQVVALLGANGAGKSTLLKAIGGMLPVEDGEVSSGRILIYEDRIDKWTTEKIARLGVSLVMEGHPILEHLTVEENLMIGAYNRKDTANVKNALEIVYGYFPVLKRLQKGTSGYLSGGEQQMLVVGRSLMAQPVLMLLDEPSLGLSPLLVKEIFSVIEDIHREQKIAFLVVEQNAKAALGIADHGYVMENGRIVLDEPAEVLKENEDIKEFYLGLSISGERKSFREVKHYKRRKRWL